MATALARSMFPEKSVLTVPAEPKVGSKSPLAVWPNTPVAIINETMIAVANVRISCKAGFLILVSLPPCYLHLPHPQITQMILCNLWIEVLRLWPENVEDC